METNEKIETGVKMYLNGEGTLTQLQSILGINKDLIVARLKELGYTIKRGYKLSTVVGLKAATEEYLANFNNNPSLTQIAAKHGIKRQTLSSHIKELGYEVINHQNRLKFDNTIFDSIDTEEKAYWLGFIFADGYVSDNNDFAVSLSIKDFNHLNSLHLFMKTEKQIGFNETSCRLSVRDTHLVNILKSYGCIPRKSLVLEFPEEKIFKDIELIKHFIRGFVDGDGCITYTNKEHTKPQLSILGTEQFLNKLQEYLPIDFIHQLGYNNKSKSLITRVLSFNGSVAYNVCKFLYQDSKVYLDRKYEKFLEICRLYEESYKLLLGKNGEGCDATAVVNSEIAQGSESPYSVESE